MVIETLDWAQEPLAGCRGGAVTVGNFDGLHRGHAALFAAVRDLARNVGGPAVALSFDPHPLRLLAPASFPPLLTTPADRAELLPPFGIDRLVLLRTTAELLSLSPEDFFTQILLGRLRARALAEGPNFRFGRHRAGDVDLLHRLCPPGGVRFEVVPPLVLDGELVSSSRIRAALQRGDVRTAERLLGRPYRLRGVVGVGQRRGRTLGFPTANLERLETLIPPDGVYAVRVGQPDSRKTWAGAANIGPNPTFGEEARKVEVHLIDFAGDLYGQELTVDFLDRLRDTRPFAGPEALVAQLRQDIEAARRLCPG